jgi:serine/threonine protein kinase
MEQLINRVVGDRYQIKSLLGRQTGRRTFLATDLQTNSDVVIKLLLFGPDFTWEDLKLFEREAEVLKSLAHPAIPQYLNSFEIETELGKGFALVQTYIEAKSLQDWIQSGRTFSEDEIKAIAIKLLKILSYLHSRQPAVVHRDIKPSNILLTTNRSGNSPGEIYLVDFGSVQTAAHGGTRTIVGTYGYMPPEQFGGETTPASDLYALGATLIYLATGQHPDKLPHKQMRIHFEDRVNLSPNLINWLQGLTQPNLNSRLPSASVALQILTLEGTYINLPGWVSDSLAGLFGYLLEKQIPNLTSSPLEQSNLPKRSGTILTKPAGSRVQIAKTRDTLDILLPPRGFHFGLIPTIFGVILYNGALASLWNDLVLILSNGDFSRLLSLLSIIPHFAVGMELWFIGSIVLTLLGRVRVRITPVKIYLTRELFGLRYLPAVTAVRQNIVKLELTRRYYRQVSSKNGGNQTIALPPQINIWAGTKKLSLGGNNVLSSPELDWLAGELSSWLKLPVTSD